MGNELDGRMPLNDLLVFHKLSRSLSASFDRDTILSTILENMEQTVGAELWTLLLLDEKTRRLHYAIAAGGAQQALENLSVNVGEGIAGWVAEHGESLIVPEADPDSRLNTIAPNHSRLIRSVIALPLRGRKGTLGVIEIYNPRAEQLTDYTIAFLHILADHAAIAIENASDVAKIQQLTITDDTTGLYNVRHLYDVLGRQLRHALNHAEPLSVAFLDLDRFKQVNDAHGHLTGSELLAKAGQRIADLSRTQDLCFRYGGDEFVVVMPTASAVEAEELMQNLLRRLMTTSFVMKNGQTLRISASIGVATAPSDGRDLHAILGAADARMYRVKSEGRGRVCGSRNR